MSLVSRRDVLASLLRTVGASWLPGMASGASPASLTVVVGAGLAGLSAAHRLRQAGINVLLIEQAGLAGGRIRTVRDYFADGGWVDVGAQSAGSGYTNFLAMCDAYDVALAPPTPQPASRPDALLRIDGQLYRQSSLKADPTRWPVQLHEHEYALAPARLLGAYLMPVARKIASPANVLNPDFSVYDGMTLRDFLQREGASMGAIELIEQPLNYNSLDSVSALSALRDATRRLVSQSAVYIAGGNDHLPRAMAAAMTDHIHYQTSLRRVRQQDHAVELTLERMGIEHTLSAEHVILTLPTTALRDVDISPTPPVDRTEIINDLAYTQVAKTHVQTRSRFWDADGDVSSFYSDSRFERIFDMSETMGSRRGLLLNWVNGEGLDTFAGLTSREHAAQVVAWMRQVWPEHKHEFETALTTNWGTTYAKGAYAHYAPGQLQKWAPKIAKPLGRLHFAGEHTQLVEPGMEAAVTSGLRAAEEVLARQ
ncbi:MAG: NAD(P)/FAD-dependent oxidoreductase [Pseudomonadota bacterium]